MKNRKPKKGNTMKSTNVQFINGLFPLQDFLHVTGSAMINQF